MGFLTPESTVVISDGVIDAEINGSLVLMGPDATQYFGLDVIGSEVWKLLEHPIAVAEIQAHCQRLYTGDRSKIDSDVLQLLQQLNDSGLIEER